MKIKHIMSNREEKVMEHLWENEAAMTITELEELMVEEGLSKASIFKAVQALIKCSYIKVSGVELVGKTSHRFAVDDKTGQIDTFIVVDAHS